jgi:hypothetical protein
MIAKPPSADPGQFAMRAGFSPTKNRRPSVTGWLAVLSCALFQFAWADEFGDFTYTDEGTTITITDFPDNAVGPVVIPDEIVGKPVTAIGMSAFQLCTQITSVTVPTTVTSIGNQAFFGCSALVSINIPAGVTVIGDSAFESCIALASMTIPDSMTAIGNSVFLSCQSMTSITLPATITSLGNNAFFNCKTLAAISLPAAVTSIGTFAFRYCESLTSIQIPAGVVSIPFGCFSDCTGLTNIVLPSGLTTILGSSFANCSSLPALSIPSTVTSIGTFAFTRCSSLTSLVLPNGVTTISNNMFELCTSLVSVTLPSSATSIGASAFLNCRALTSLAIPAGVFSLGTDAFGLCLALTSITVDPLNNTFSSLDGVLFNKAQSTLIVYPRGLAGPYVVPGTVTAISSAAFRFAQSVTSIEIPASATSIGTEAFAGCAALTSFSVASDNPNWNTLDGVLTTKSTFTIVAFPGGRSGAYTVPSGVTNIGASAFRYSPLLTEIIFPSSITTLGANAAAGCPLLAKVTFQGNAPPTVSSTPFAFTATGFKVFYYSTSTGFTNPWKGYVTEQILIANPFGSWLENYELPTNSPLSLDSNGDGVSLLMAYALDLDPRENLSGAVPQVVFSPTQMSLSYHSAAEGVTYVVEVSPDLKTWSDVGVTVTGPDANGISTATANRTGDVRFMRLAVAY